MAVVLIGFMGVGKTTIGQQLAKVYNKPFVDLDSAIVKHVGLAIPDIFKQKGESYFRAIESELLVKFIDQDIVLATGGGIVENPNNLGIMKKNKLNIWVDTNINTVYNRIVGDSNRPNANQKSLDEIKKLYNNRISRYNEIAYIKVGNDSDVDSCVQKIHNQIIADDEN
ncbi:shikimate kinase [Macrococcus capreoli]